MESCRISIINSRFMIGLIGAPRRLLSLKGALAEPEEVPNLEVPSLKPLAPKPGAPM